MGYWLAEPYWNKGIVSRVVNIMTKYAFTNLDIVRLQAQFFSWNPISMKVLENAAWPKERILRDAVFKDGKTCDCHLFSILQTEYYSV